MKCNLGTIVNNKMILSDFGKIVEQEWFQSFKIRNELILHEFVLMPNHVHAIVEIYNGNGDELGGDNIDVNNIVVGDFTVVDELAVETLETHGRVSLTKNPITQQNPPYPPIPDISSIKPNPPKRLPKSISSFIAGFKSAVNNKIDNLIDEQNLPIPKYNRNNHFFQPNYHDHIIRNNIEFQKISNYIINNPKNWNNDKFIK
jgi:putative transposase